MRSEILTALIEARQLIAECWAQSSSGVDQDGLPVSCMLPKAVGFCLLGAIERATNADREIYRLAYERVHDVVRPDCRSLMLWNDTPGRTQAEVLDAIDRAIAAMLTETVIAPPAVTRELEPA